MASMLRLWLGAMLSATCSFSSAEPSRTLATVMSGYEFQSDETQALQDDSFASPGLLWRDQGQRLFQQREEGAVSCSSCHTSKSLAGAATRYPQYSPAKRQLINIEQRINQCREEQQNAAPWAYESEALLAITTFVASLSSGMPFSVDITGPAKPFFEQGRAYYYQRLGQLDLACNHCHEQNVGKKLRGDTLSQGHSNNYPTYRLDWQSQGSLHRRLRFCNTGVRAKPFDFGAEQYVNLELYLAWRASSLPLEVPSVRR